MGVSELRTTSQGPTCWDSIQRASGIGMCRADLHAAALRGPTYAQWAARRQLANLTSTSDHDQGPEPKLPPGAAAEAHQPDAQPRPPFHAEIAPKPRAARRDVGPTRPLWATSTGNGGAWGLQNHARPTPRGVSPPAASRSSAQRSAPGNPELDDMWVDLRAMSTPVTKPTVKSSEGWAVTVCADRKAAMRRDGHERGGS